MKYKNIRFRMFYVDLTNPATRKQNCSNFSFIIDFSWRSSIPGTLDGGRICWLLSEILFCRPKMNKQKSDLALKKAASYVMRRMCQPVWFHIHQPVICRDYSTPSQILDYIFHASPFLPLQSVQFQVVKATEKVSLTLWSWQRLANCKGKVVARFQGKGKGNFDKI